MPRKVGSSITSNLRKAQKDTFPDVCNVFRVSTTGGTYSDDETEMVTGTYSVPCGIRFISAVPNRDKFDAEEPLLFVNYDAVVRFPLTQELDLSDRLEFVQKGGFAVSGTFNIVEEPNILSSVKKYKVRRIT